MSILILRHARKNGTGHLSFEGKAQALFYATELWQLFRNLFGRVTPQLFAYDGYPDGAQRCIATLLPLAFHHDLSIHRFTDIQCFKTWKNSSLCAIICCEHTQTGELVRCLDPESPSFYWGNDNFCTVLVLRRGRYENALPLLYADRDAMVFEKFKDQLFTPLQYNIQQPAVWLEGIRFYRSVPLGAYLFLEYLQFRLPRFSVQIFGGWIRLMLQGFSDFRNHDLDIRIVPCCDQELLRRLVQEYASNLSSPHTLEWSEKQVLPQGHFVMNVQIDEEPCMDLSTWASKDTDGDFQCNSASMEFPFTSNIVYRYAETKNDILYYRLRFTQRYSRFVGPDMSVNYQRADALHKAEYHVLVRRLSRMVQKQYTLVHANDREWLVSFLDSVDWRPFLSILSNNELFCLYEKLGGTSKEKEAETVHDAILLLGSHTGFTEEQLGGPVQRAADILHVFLSDTATIVSGIYNHQMREIIDALLAASDRRKLVWVAYRPEHVDFQQTIQHSRFRDQIECVVFDNLLPRTLRLFSAESFDRIYVFPGNEGTLWEEKTMDMMKMSYTKMYVSSLGADK